jgi:hypothetical protein
MAKTCIGILEEDYESASLKLMEIAEKDDTFRYKIYESKYINEFDYIVVVYSNDVDTAHKRGLWLVNKANIGERYWVIE